MANPIDELMTRSYVPPADDGDEDTVPAYLELSDGSFVSVADASQAQVLLSARLHREIARRHALEAEKLERFLGHRELE